MFFWVERYRPRAEVRHPVDSACRTAIREDHVIVVMGDEALHVNGRHIAKDSRFREDPIHGVALSSQNLC